MQDDNNENIFSSSEYLSKKQVLSAFSRMSKLYKDGRLERPVEATRSSYAKVSETEEITSNNEDAFQGDEQAGVDECLQQLKESDRLHNEQSKDGKSDNAEDQEDSAIKKRGRGKKGKKKFFNEDKFWEIVPIYGDGNCLFCAVASENDKTLFSCSRKESGYSFSK